MRDVTEALRWWTRRPARLDGYLEFLKGRQLVTADAMAPLVAQTKQAAIRMRLLEVFNDAYVPRPHYAAAVET